MLLTSIGENRSTSEDKVNAEVLADLKVYVYNLGNPERISEVTEIVNKVTNILNIKEDLVLASVIKKLQTNLDVSINNNKYFAIAVGNKPSKVEYKDRYNPIESITTYVEKNCKDFKVKFLLTKLLVECL